MLRRWSKMRKCEKCDAPAYCYAMGRFAGDWGGYYCKTHIPTGFMIDTLIQSKEAH
jgi:hypothetical protein